MQSTCMVDVVLGASTSGYQGLSAQMLAIVVYERKSLARSSATAIELERSAVLKLVGL